MIKLLGKGKDLEHSYYSEFKANYIIKDLNHNGFEGKYIEVEGVIVYPNYQEADEIVSAWVMSENMQEASGNSWEYIDDKKEQDNGIKWMLWLPSSINRYMQ